MTVLNFPDTSGKPTDGSFIYVANGVIYTWDGDKWTSLGATIISDENNAIIGAAAPATTVNGTFWYDTVAGHLKVLVNGTWKDVRPSS